MLGLLVAYMVLAAQFNAFTHPFTVLLALPFSISGALLALWIAGQSLNVYSMLGMILLMGIAKKNSILLVDFTNQIREQRRRAPRGAPRGVPDPPAADPHDLDRHDRRARCRRRSRIGPGAELQRPMALALVGGMVGLDRCSRCSWCPAAYSLIDDGAVALERRAQGRGEGSSLRAARSPQRLR